MTAWVFFIFVINGIYWNVGNQLRMFISLGLRPLHPAGDDVNDVDDEERTVIMWGPIRFFFSGSWMDLTILKEEKWTSPIL